MVRSDVIKLVSKTYKPDAVGNQIPEETARTVFCNVDSVSQREFYDAGEAGLKPAYKFTMFRYDYAGEDEVEYNGKRYHVYRTYNATSDDTEMYVEERAGV